MPGGADHEALAEVAAAVVRSIATTPDAARAVCDAVADGMCAALWARRGLHWVLASAARLAQPLGPGAKVTITQPCIF